MALLKNQNPKGHEHPTVVFKRKQHRSEEGHHGGVWKIAYADFMTAMMTFFLVMWLINSASKEKITQLANYFNPVKLHDRVPGAKGVSENHNAGGESENTAPNKPSKDTAKPGAKPNPTPHTTEEEALFRNPFGALSQLASQAEATMTAVMPETNMDNLSAGGSSHDPFITDPIMNQPLNHAPPRPVQQEPAPEAASDTRPPLPPLHQDKEASQQAAARISKPAPSSPDKEVSRETAETAARLEKDLAHLIQSLPPSFRPDISTKATSEGSLISLTDHTNFSMFKIASPEPSPQLVLVLQKVGELINKYPGQIIVRGHTDGRPYAGDRYGNWRLSVNRATMAYYMLLRGKLDESRFLALEGYADRNPKNKADPLAGNNRRIEILIKGADKP
ncbi:MAG: flagellar motor protein MotB [Rhodomicrobium sp.]